MSFLVGICAGLTCHPYEYWVREAYSKYHEWSLYQNPYVYCWESSGFWFGVILADYTSIGRLPLEDVIKLQSGCPCPIEATKLILKDIPKECYPQFMARIISYPAVEEDEYWSAANILKDLEKSKMVYAMLGLDFSGEIITALKN